MSAHMLMEQPAYRTHANAREHPCTCACTSITPAHHGTPGCTVTAPPQKRILAGIQLCSAPNAPSTHRHTAHMQTRTGRAPCMHSHSHTRFQLKPACQERFILQLGMRRQWAPSRTLQPGSAAGTDTLPIPPQSPSLPPAQLHLTP